MCIVLDANTFAHVFDASSKKHKQFAPVTDWILHGKGFVVYGGTRYKRELRAARKYLALFLELKRAGNAVEILQHVVDADEAHVSSLVQHRDFDDQHIVAILRSSWCKLFCSLDSRADRFIKDEQFYLKGQSTPSIYRSRTHVKLLIDKNIVKVKNGA
jgi:predicted nucleic acid-binding protein